MQRDVTIPPGEQWAHWSNASLLVWIMTRSIKIEPIYM